MQWPTDPIIGQQIIVVVVLAAFLFLAALCLSARAFTQLLDLIAKRGLWGKAQGPEDPQVQTGSLRETGTGRKSARKGGDRTTSVTANIELEDK
jgi:hypothetical protein